MIASPLKPFLDLRVAVVAERIGDGGVDTCEVLSDGLDSALRDLADGVGPGASIVAVGGYGRREQCLWSDVDLMVLHRGGDAELLVRAVLYPLWDADLKVGHAVRTVAESLDAGGDRMDTLTSLLSARLVAGDEELFGELMAALSGLLETHPLTSWLVEQERERRRREPYPTMAANVKEGRGALRTHQGLWWERRRADLIGTGADEASDAEREARGTLLAIRNSLHAAAGRAVDQFHFDLRESAAEWLGDDLQTMASALTHALHVGDQLADRRWPDLHAEPDPTVSLGRKLFGAIRSRFSAPSSEPAPAGSVLTLAVEAAGRTTGAWFEPDEEDLIRNAPARQWTPADRTAFVTLLTAGLRGRTIFGRLEELGWVDREFPEWSAIATAPQLAPFHDHPVGAHLWRTADEMEALIEDPGEVGSIASEVGSTEELLLAAFLHDIGKARGGNHSIVGADLAASFLRRVGFGPATAGVVVDAVRLHLLLSETATRRDIADLDVIDEVAAMVGDLRRLEVLYLLTIADLRATGTTMWNPWRASLLHTLYQRVREAIEAGGAPPATPNVQAIIDLADPGLERRAVEEHVAAMPTDYLDGATPREVLWHLDVAARLHDPVEVSVDPDDAGRVLVAGKDRAGFLLAVSRAFTANGIAIMDARLRTRTDGIALDTFHVCDDRTGETVEPVRWDRLARDLAAALSGTHDFGPAIRERVRAYRSPTHDPGDIELRAEVADRYTVIEVRTPDRVGLLTDIVEALFEEGLDIHLARIDTMGGVARDVFYVRRTSGVPIRHDDELAALRARLEGRLRG